MKTASQQMAAAVLACAGAVAAQGNGSSSGTVPQLTTATVSSGPPLSPPPQTGCPTVTSTRELCATCVVPACLQMATLTQLCGCPTPVPTVYLDFPCSSSCSGVWCFTTFTVMSAEGLETCASSTSSPSTITSTTTLGSSFPSPPLSFRPNLTTVFTTTQLSPTASAPTLSGPPINAAGRPRPFRFWL